MNAFSFGSYCPGDSAIHRMDPRAKLVLGFAFLILSLVAGSWRALVAIAVFVAACLAVSRVPVERIWRSTAPLLGIVVLVALVRLAVDAGGAVIVALGPLGITTAGLRSCAFIAVRLTLMMLGMSLITLTTTTLDLTAGFERLMQPFARFGLPAHELGMMLGLALRFMPEFAGEMRDTYNAQVSRGAQLKGGVTGGVRMLASVAVPLFASVFRHAETLSQAMDARCYHGERGRTRLHPLRYTCVDAAAVAVVACLGLSILFLR